MAEQIIKNPSITPGDLNIELSGGYVTAISGHPVGVTGSGTYYDGDGTYIEIVDKNTITLTDEAAEKLNREIPTTVAELTDADDYLTTADAANTYQTIEGMSDYVGQQEYNDFKSVTNSKLNGKQNKLNFGYDVNNAISSIDGHEIAGTGGSSNYSAGTDLKIENNIISVDTNGNPNNTASNTRNFVEGSWTVASGYMNHAEGVATSALGYGVHTHGMWTKFSSNDGQLNGGGTGPIYWGAGAGATVEGYCNATTSCPMSGTEGQENYGPIHGGVLKVIGNGFVENEDHETDVHVPHPSDALIIFKDGTISAFGDIFNNDKKYVTEDAISSYNVTAQQGVEVTPTYDSTNKTVTFGISITATPVVTDTTLSGYNGIAAAKDGNVSGQWNVGLTNDMLNTINGKLDSTVAEETYQEKGDYATNTDLQTVSADVEAISGELPNFALKSEIPTKVSDLTDSANYYKTTETSGAAEISTALGNKVDKPDTTQVELNNKYLIYSTLSAEGQPKGWVDMQAKVYSKTEADGTFVATANIDTTTLSGDGKSVSTKLGVNTNVIQTKLTDEQLSAIGEVSSKLDRADLDDYVPYSATELVIGSGNEVDYQYNNVKNNFVQGTNNIVTNNNSETFVQGKANKLFTSQDSFVQGFGNSATNYYCLAQGALNDASTYSLTQGSHNTANSYSQAAGQANSAITASVAFGDANTAKDYSVAQGTQNSADTTAFAQGSANKARYGSFAQGNSNSAYYFALTQGNHNSADYGSFAQGQSNIAQSYSIAQGWKNSASNNSVAQGSNNYAKYYSQAFGFGLSIEGIPGDSETYISGGLALGTFNQTSAGVALVIGDGHSNGENADPTRSDSFIIYADGSVSSKGDISANGVKLGPGGGSFTGVYTGTGLSGNGLSNSPLGIDTTAAINFTNGSAKSATSALSANKAGSAQSAKWLRDDNATVSASDVTALQNWASTNSSTWDGVSAKLGTAQYAADSATFVTSSNSTIIGTKQYALTTAGWAEITGGSIVGDYVPFSATELPIGTNNTATTNAAAIGGLNSAVDLSFALGNGNSAKTTGCAIGESNYAYNKSVAIGYQNTANYNVDIAIGYQNSSYDHAATLINHNIAKTYSFAAGDCNTAINYSFTLGRGLKLDNTNGGANSFGGLAIGGWNYTTADAMFVIGNGSPNANKDYFVLKKDGSVAFGEGTSAQFIGSFAEGFHTSAIGVGVRAVGAFTRFSVSNTAEHAIYDWEGRGVTVEGYANLTTAHTYSGKQGESNYGKIHGGVLKVIGNGAADSKGITGSDAYILYRDGTVSAKQFQNADGTETINGTTYNFTGVDNIEILPNAATANTANFPNDNVLRFILES